MLAPCRRRPSASCSSARRGSGRSRDQEVRGRISCSSLEPPCARKGRAMLVDPNDRRVDRDYPVQVLVRHREGLGVLKDTRPHSGFGPSVEVLVDDVPVPEPFGCIPPRRTGSVMPGGCFHDQASIHRRAPRRRSREHRADHGPHLIGDHIARRAFKSRRRTLGWVSDTL